MARKNLLEGLMGPNADTPEQGGAHDRRVDPARPRYATGAIGAVSESIAALKSRALIDLDPHLIDAGGLNDRIEHDDQDHARLMASLKEYGQQVPILVRPHPDEKDRYQIVYGRRRVLALRDLGLDAKAMVRDLDDRALVMAQGQENATRRDLSFIEKCNFAQQMMDADYDRKAICDALNVDKTLVSRMLAVTEAVPVDLIEVIGAAPAIGRDRWLTFAKLLTDTHTGTDALIDMITVNALDGPSEARFEAALDYVQAKSRGAKTPVTKPRQPAAKREVVQTENGFNIGTVSRGADAVTVNIPRQGSGGFDDWLADNLSEIHRSWIKDSRGE